MLSVRRLVAFALALSLAACGGGGRALFGGNPSAPSASGGGRGNVTLALAIPSQGASASGAARKPATISSSTQSISVIVNGAAPQIFNLGSCTGTTTLTCSLSVGAPYGLDTFLIETYSGTGGSGTALNAAAATLNVTPGGPNSLSTTAGNIVYVTTNADTGSGSLRAAITGAAAGVTTAVLFQGVTGTITLASPIPITQDVAIIGPGASSLSISGAGATQLFTVSSGQVAAIFGLTLTKGFSNLSGGAIANNGTLSIYSSTFTSNTASNPGSAFGFGGAIVNSGTLVVTGGTFTGNSAVGPASYGATGGAIDSIGDATIDSSTFTNNSATSSGGGTFGGAIAMTAFNTTGLAITNSQFYGNLAGGSNATYGYGGAIFDSSGDTLTLSGDAFGKSGAGNTASGTSDSFGGAIATYSSPNYTSIDLSGTNSFAYNAVSSASTSSYSGGGAIANGGDLFISGTNSFSNNSVNAGPNAQSGGYAAGGAINSVPPGCSGGLSQIDIAGTTTFTNNSVAATDALGSAVGGAINYENTTDDCSVARRPAPDAHHGTSLKALTQRALPAGLARASRPRRTTSGSPVYSIAGATFTGNTATGGTNSYFGTTGGALQAADASPAVAITASVFSGNAARAGIFANGGAIAVYGGGLTLTGSTIAGNSATGAGGGLQVTSGGTLDLEQSVVSSNTVTGDATQDTGGGIVDFGSPLILNQSTVSGNALAGSLAGSGGGGLSIVNGATATVTNSTIAGNSSTINGGGIFVDGSAEYGYATATFVNLTVYQNTANTSSGNGGNIDVQASGNSVTIGNSIVAGGSAQTDDDYYDAAGALYTDSGYNLFQHLPSLIPPALFAPSTAHFIGDDPGLATAGLASNGGPTPTIADTSSSPGKGTIPFAGGLCNGLTGTSLDQRGLSRGIGRGGVPAGFCDIGAYEYP